MQKRGHARGAYPLFSLCKDNTFSPHLQEVVNTHTHFENRHLEHFSALPTPLLPFPQCCNFGSSEAFLNRRFENTNRDVEDVLQARNTPFGAERANVKIASPARARYAPHLRFCNNPFRRPAKVAERPAIGRCGGAARCGKQCG